MIDRRDMTIYGKSLMTVDWELYGDQPVWRSWQKNVTYGYGVLGVELELWAFVPLFLDLWHKNFY